MAEARKNHRRERSATAVTHIFVGFIGGMLAGVVFNILHWIILGLFSAMTGTIVSQYFFAILCMGIGAIGIKMHFLGTVAFFLGALLVSYFLYTLFDANVIFLTPGR